MSGRDKASLALMLVWIIMCILLGICALIIGNKNVEARHIITKCLYIYICTLPTYGIAQAIIQRKHMIISIVLLSVFAVCLWYFIVPLVIR